MAHLKQIPIINKKVALQTMLDIMQNGKLAAEVGLTLIALMDIGAKDMHQIEVTKEYLIWLIREFEQLSL